MAESTLTLALDDLRSEVGAFLGWSRTSTNWDARKQAEIKQCVASCLRKFYFQALIDPKDSAHGWTFLKPVATLSVAASADSCALPDDFGGFDGMVTVSQVGGGNFWPLRQRHEEQIRALYAANQSTTGRPAMYAESQRKGTTETRSNRSELMVWPLTDAAYIFQVPYYILPDYLTDLNPYPYGGAAHAETMKAGARAAAELFLDNAPGPETANYMQCLAASIQYDRRHQPKSLGVNVDMSDWYRGGRGDWPAGLWEPQGIGYLSNAPYS